VIEDGVFVTGMGVVSCLGCGVDRFWRALCEGRNGLGPVDRFDLEGSPYVTGGQVRDFPAVPFAECGLSLGAQFAVEAAAMALADYPAELSPTVGLVLATNFGPAELLEAELGGRACEGPGSCRLAGGLFAGQARGVAHSLGVGGPLTTISLSCASGNAAIAHALDLIRSGRADAVLVCGYDSIQRVSWAGLACLRVMALPREGAPALVRPFDRGRSGTIFSEGAGCLLLEAGVAARERGAELLAEAAGAAANNNAYHLAHADEEGTGTAVAIRMALADADIAPDQVDHVNAHGTGTRLNDAIETRALCAVFGDRAGQMPVVSNKGGLGHGMGAASSFEAVASVMTLREGVMPPTVNLAELDPDCALDVVAGEPRSADLSVVLSNSSGIGGANAAVVLRRVAPEQADDGGANDG